MTDHVDPSAPAPSHLTPAGVTPRDASALAQSLAAIGYGGFALLQPTALERIHPMSAVADLLRSAPAADQDTPLVPDLAAETPAPLPPSNDTTAHADAHGPVSPHAAAVADGAPVAALPVAALAPTSVDVAAAGEPAPWQQEPPALADAPTLGATPAPAADVSPAVYAAPEALPVLAVPDAQVDEATPEVAPVIDAAFAQPQEAVLPVLAASPVADQGAVDAVPTGWLGPDAALPLTRPTVAPPAAEPALGWPQAVPSAAPGADSTPRDVAAQEVAAQQVVTQAAPEGGAVPTAALAPTPVPAPVPVARPVGIPAQRPAPTRATPGPRGAAYLQEIGFLDE